MLWNLESTCRVRAPAVMVPPDGKLLVLPCSLEVPGFPASPLQGLHLRRNESGASPACAGQEASAPSADQGPGTGVSAPAGRLPLTE